METLIYLGKVNLYWILLYTCYHLILRKHTFFQLNRLFLLGSLLLAFLLPLIIYPATAPPVPVIYEVSAESITISYDTREDPSLLTWTNLAWIIYAFGVLFSAFRVMRQIFGLTNYIKQGELIDLDGCTLILIDSNEVGSFSFLKWIVINRNDYAHHFDAILRHEMVHTQQWHSADILLLEITKTIFWFNPVLLLYKHAIQEVHEFLADSQAPNKETYARFLLSYALNAPGASLTNHFFKTSQVKNRIQMIYKSRSSKWMLGSYLIALATIGAVAMFVAGCEQKGKSSVSGEVISTHEGGVVSGVITDEKGNALPGANVLVNGVERGTSTNSNGKFELDVPPNGELVVSFPEFKTQIVQIGDVSKVISIQLDKGDGSVTLTGPVKEHTLEYHEPATEINGKKIFTVVEKQPEFQGGIGKMYEFLANNIQYPEAASRADVSGKVFVSFVVTETGEIHNVQVLKGIGFGCDEEAVRVVKAFPKWIPGSHDGVPVNVKYNLPINFVLEEKNTTFLKTKKNSKNPIAIPADKVSKDAQLAAVPSTDTGQANTSKADNKSARYANINERFFAQKEMPIGLRGNELNFDEKKPLIFIDGVKQKERGNAGMANLDVNSISSISVLKNPSASDVYGEEGKNGVILVETQEKSGKPPVKLKILAD
jgi:TonB family protein